MHERLGGRFEDALLQALQRLGEVIEQGEVPVHQRVGQQVGHEVQALAHRVLGVEVHALLDRADGLVHRVVHGDEEAIAQEEVQFVHHHFGWGAGAQREALQHQELVARVVLQLGALVEVQAVLHGQLVEAEARRQPGHGRFVGALHVDPHRAGAVGSQQLFATPGELPVLEHAHAQHGRRIAAFREVSLWGRYSPDALETALPPRLLELLQQVPEPAFASRLKAVFDASSAAISRLGELDLSKYEDTAIDGTADLSLWEELAPHVGATIAAVNALVGEMGRHFPPDAPAFDQRQASVVQVVTTTAQELRENVMKFGMSIRDPNVVGDRWALLTELQSFRASFRDRIGLCVFEICQQLEECRRSEVDPGYEEALGQALQLRATTSDFRRLMRSRIQKVSESTNPDLGPQVGQVELELNAFRKTSAWRAMRAQDKKRALEFRAMLEPLKRPALGKIELLEFLEPLVEFVDSFADINDREILVQHDRERQAAIGVALENAVNAGTDESALAAFGQAVTEAQRLYGRSADVDAFLRKLRRATPTVASFRPDLDQFLMLLANLNLY